MLAGCNGDMATDTESSGSTTEDDESQAVVDTGLLSSAGMTGGSHPPGFMRTSSDTHNYMINPPQNIGSIRKSAYALPPASLTFKNLTFSLPGANGKKKKGKTVLEPCSGHFEAGQLSALMGPSGSGKTTLLDMLAMKKTANYSGEVWVNGFPRNFLLFRRVAAYVGQDDIMPAHWKVREAITFNAVLKQNPTRKHKTIDEWIDVLVTVFGLKEVENSIIGDTEVRGISGGQRRRVTLARGVAAHASLLFCDEPTSGLSATDAELCVQALRIICKRLGVTCFVVIHQPRAEVAEMFDTLVLLSSDPGRMVYFGSMAQAQAYWQEIGLQVPQNVNPTDFFMDTVTPGTRLNQVESILEAFKRLQKPKIEEQVTMALQKQGMKIEDMLTQSDLSRLEERGRRKPAKQHQYAIGFSGQFLALLRRKVVLTVRNPMALGLPLAVPIVQGIIIGYLFEGTGSKPFMRQVMFAFCLLTMLCLAGTMGLIVLITERTLMKHEASEALYSEGAWALSQQCVDIPLALVGAVLNVLIMSWWAGLQWDLLETVGIWALLLFFVYDSLFAFIGAVATDTRQSQVLASPCVSVFMLFNGFIVTKSDAPAPLRWIFEISPNAYAMEAIVVKMSEGPNVGFEAKMIMASSGYEPGSPSKGFVVLGTMIIILRVGQMLGLKYLHHIKR